MHGRPVHRASTYPVQRLVCFDLLVGDVWSARRICAPIEPLHMEYALPNFQSTPLGEVEQLDVRFQGHVEGVALEDDVEVAGQDFVVLSIHRLDVVGPALETGKDDRDVLDVRQAADEVEGGVAVLESFK